MIARYPRIHVILNATTHWQLWELTAVDTDSSEVLKTSSLAFQDREGDWWLATSTVFNTEAHLEKTIAPEDSWDEWWETTTVR